MLHKLNTPNKREVVFLNSTFSASAYEFYTHRGTYIDKAFSWLLTFMFDCVAHSASTFRLLSTRSLNFTKYIYTRYNFVLSGVLYTFRILVLWIPTLIFMLLIVYTSLALRLVPFSKVLVEWFIVAMLVYWLISGFVFFNKKYQSGKYTSSIQRFWRRSFAIFWLLETFLFSIFLYLTFNSANESVNMYDYIQLNKTHLYSWKFFIAKMFPLTIIIFLGYLLLLNTKWNTFTKYIFAAFFITILFAYIIWVEFYQFFYVINWYGELSWLFDLETKIWELDTNFKRSRIVNHYISLCVILKFWHLLFVFVFWIFFVLRAIEAKKVTYGLLSANLQNFLIIYVMSWLLMYPWVKYAFRRHLSNAYFWFFQSPRNYAAYGVWHDIYIYFLGFVSIFNDCGQKTFYNFFCFYYMYFNSGELATYRAHFIRSVIITHLTNA